MKKLLGFALAGSLLLVACTQGSTAGVTIGSAPNPNLKSTASFDVIEIDQRAQLLYAADRTDMGVDVFDVSNAPGSYVRTISLSSTPNGLAVAPDLGRVFVGLENGSLAIIDAKANSVIKEVPSGDKSLDLIDYAPTLHRVFAGTGISGDVVSFDATTGDVIATFNVGFALEQPRFNTGDRLLYVDSPDADTLFQLDPNSGAVKGKIKLGGCQAKGLAINPRLNQALIACPQAVMRMNLQKWTDAELFLDVPAGDIVNYDPVADRFLVAEPLGKPTGVGVLGGNPIKYVDAVQNVGGGNSAAYDEASGIVYTPDTRAGSAGLASFKLPTGDHPISVPVSAVAELAGVLAAVILAMFLIGRLADPVRRPEPLPRRRRA